MVGNKTGSGDNGTTNDIAIIWPTNGSPIVVAMYFTQHDKNAHTRGDVLASATRTILGEMFNEKTTER